MDSWRFFKKSLPILLIVGIVLTFFWKVVFKNQVPIPGDFVVGVYYPWLDYKWGFPTGVPVKNPITTDVVSFTYPMQIYAVDLLKKGQWPLWNPYILAGTPLLANFQSAPFSPTNFLYFLTDKLTAWSIQIVLQHVLAAVFTYFFLRYWEVSRRGAVLGGIIFAFSGFNLIWSQWNGHTLAASFIPLLLLFESKFFDKKSIFSGIGISVVLAFQILSGYPQVVLYSLVAMGLLWVIKIRSVKNIFRSTLLLGLFLVLGLGLSAFQILPGKELLSISQRAVERHPFEWAFLPWEKIITFIAPDYFGNHATQNYWGPQDYTSNTGFVGVVAFIFTILAAKFLKKNRRVLYSFLLLTVSLILAFPTPVAVFIWKSGLFGLQAASAHRALTLTNLSFALLTGFGFDFFIRKKLSFRDLTQTLLLPFLLILGFGGYAFTLFFLSRNNPSVCDPLSKGVASCQIGLRNLVIPVGVFLAISFLLLVSQKFNFVKKLSFWVVLLLVIVEIFKFGWKFTPFSPRSIVFPTTPVLDFLISQKPPFRVTGNKVIPINLRMPYGLESPEGYDAVYTVSIAKFLSALNDMSGNATFTGRYGSVDREDSHLLDLLNTKYFLAVKTDKQGNVDPKGSLPKIYQSSRFRVAYEDKSTVVLESKSVLPRAFMVYDWEILKGNREILDKLVDPNYPIGKKIILDEDPKITHATKEILTSSVNYLEYSQQKSILEINSVKGGMLFVSDSFFPGWKAYVDGKETRIFKADFAFRAIPVSKGKHTVEMIYRPNSFFDGLKLSLASLVCLIFLVLWNKRFPKAILGL